MDAKHSHYKKDVTGLNMIDVYRALDLFGVTDPCIQHACKKLLVTGNRGHKNTDQDIQDAIDTLERWKEMRAEDRQRQSDRHPMTPNVIEPASQMQDDSPRMAAIGQNGDGGEHYDRFCLPTLIEKVFTSPIPVEFAQMCMEALEKKERVPHEGKLWLISDVTWENGCLPNHIRLITEP